MKANKLTWFLEQNHTMILNKDIVFEVNNDCVRCFEMNNDCTRKVNKLKPSIRKEKQTLEPNNEPNNFSSHQLM